MLVPLEWLHEFTRPALPTAELADRLDLTGTVVDRIHHHGVAALDFFVVGRVLSAERHPDADRLTVCHVAVGEGDTATIVCGAPNVAAGQTVAVARPGAVMPDGTTLGAAKLRGVASEGMILAEDELGIGTDHAGIMVLDDLLPGGGDLVPGTPLADVLVLETDVLELEITPNRPDCLGIYGVAREVHAATGAELAAPPWSEDPGAAAGEAQGAPVEITVEDPRDCPRFTARAFEDVRVGPSPPVAEGAAHGRRAAADQQRRGPHELRDARDGPPGARLRPRPRGRRPPRRPPGAGGRAAADARRRRPRSSTADMVVIADADGPTSLAGVMGGERSEVHDGTTRVLLEAAVWDGPNVNRTSTRLGLRSEASSRFEKGLSPEGCLEAQAVATRLFTEVLGARQVDGTVDVGGAGPEPATIRLRDARVERLLGMPVPRERSRGILTALEFGVRDAPDGLDVTVPHVRRNDVRREADLVEEVARLGALDELPATIQENRTGLPGGLTAHQRLRRRAEDVLVGLGLFEVVGWSFTEPGLLDRLLLPPDDPMRRVVELENPMSETQSILRPTILGSLLDAAAHNRARGATDLALFEAGAVYRSDPGARRRAGRLSTSRSGCSCTAATSRAPGRTGCRRRAPTSSRSRASWRPSCARCGWTGTSSRSSARTCTRAGPGPSTSAGERSGSWASCTRAPPPPGTSPTTRWRSRWSTSTASSAHAVAVPAYRDLTSFPVLRQDLAVVVGDDVPAARVAELVRRAGGDVLAKAEVFDVFRGPQLGEGRVSLALHLEFRAADRTLTDEDVAPAVDRVVAALRDELGGELRG